jgi:hypothetical protein
MTEFNNANSSNNNWPGETKKIKGVKRIQTSIADVDIHDNTMRITKHEQHIGNHGLPICGHEIHIIYSRDKND